MSIFLSYLFMSLNIQVSAKSLRIFGFDGDLEAKSILETGLAANTTGPNDWGMPPRFKSICCDRKKGLIYGYSESN